MVAHCPLAADRHQAQHYWPFVRGIHWLPVDSPNKRPVIWKTFISHDLIMILRGYTHHASYVSVMVPSYPLAAGRHMSVSAHQKCYIVIHPHLPPALDLAAVNTLRPRQNGRHFAEDTFNRIFVNEDARISIKFSLKFVPKGPINNIPALVQITAWRRPGDKQLSEPVMVSLLTHICVTRPQRVNPKHAGYVLGNIFVLFLIISVKT